MTENLPGFIGGMPWWQFVTGILAIPAALLGLVYTYRLYLKTNLEIRKIELEILAKERELGLTTELSKSPAHERRQIKINRALASIDPALRRPPRRVAIASWALLVVVIWLFPSPAPLGPAPKWVLLLCFAGLILLAGALTLATFRLLSGRKVWSVAALATTSFLLIILTAFSFLYLRAQYVVQIHLGAETREVLAGFELTSAAERYLTAHPALSSQQLLYYFALRAEYVWRAESIVAVKVGLVSLYLITAALLSVFLVAVACIAAFVMTGRAATPSPPKEPKLRKQSPSMTPNPIGHQTPRKRRR